jgi:phospholipase C
MSPVTRRRHVFTLPLAVMLSTWVLASASGARSASAALTGIHKIQHVVVIMQENRSFDQYFGTFPGANGIPMVNGVPTACLPSVAGGCKRPFVDHRDITVGVRTARRTRRTSSTAGRWTGS